MKENRCAYTIDTRLSKSTKATSCHTLLYNKVFHRLMKLNFYIVDFAAGDKWFVILISE